MSLVQASLGDDFPGDSANSWMHLVCNLSQYLGLQGTPKDDGEDREGRDMRDFGNFGPMQNNMVERPKI
ncbi:hypothetical protein N7508_006178 [Penicillium antarcticum]|uniref:uncharacterized protein n=1 Tax=Penicillium antarcticum TaxID=416450 RepID=UPI00238C164D|nr:uncharacterized protein N7508_006178 [Penicillium antarcticum]KAJ5301315.1 hypothetical protein N7508_006178 [Penicillium antarcticum]